jgi:uncharacterized protein
MELKPQLENDLHAAMKSSDVTRRDTLRMVLTSIKMAEKEKGEALDETAVIAIIQKEIKLRHETIEDAKKGDRLDVVQTIEKEIAILEKYLPEQLSESELTKLISETIKNLGLSDIKGMGAVMKDLLPKIQGKAPNDLVSKLVREQLSKG